MRPGPRAGGENAGIEHASEHHAQSLARGGRQEALQRRLLQQRIAPRQQHDVEIARLSETLTHLGFVDADADSRNHLRAAQLIESTIGSVHRLLETPLDRGRAMRPDIDVMNEKNIDAVEAEPQQ